MNLLDLANDVVLIAFGFCVARVVDWRRRRRRIRQPTFDGVRFGERHLGEFE